MRIRVLMAAAVPLLAACEQLVSPSRYAEVVVEGVRRDGSPVPGVRTVLYTGQRPMGYATTDSAGRAVFAQVPEGPAYGVFIQAPEGYALPEAIFGGPPSDVVAGFAVVRDSVHVVRFTLLREGVGTIEVAVRDATGPAIGGQLVTLYSPTTTLGTAVTDANGLARFTEVPFGVYGILLEPPGIYRDAGEPTFVYKDGLFVEEGSAVRADFALSRCLGTLDVLVHDPANGPAAGLLVTLYDSRAVRDTMRTSDAGRASFVTACGEVGVRVTGSPQWKTVPGRNGEYVDGIMIRRTASVTTTLLVERVP